ncbi:MAG: HU family DNA-binding protein [Gammaproteobacteria bacterium]|nr:HU family DNA-binding protein [Gammaproteobacteria bacterium]
MASKKLSAVKEAYTKSETLAYLADFTGLTKKECASVLEGLSNVIAKSLSPRAIGEFTVPGLMKIRRIKKPATKARKGINPFTGESMMFKAKPARNVLKFRALKKLKEMVN